MTNSKQFVFFVFCVFLNYCFGLAFSIAHCDFGLAAPGLLQI